MHQDASRFRFNKRSDSAIRLYRDKSRSETSECVLRDPVGRTWTTSKAIDAYGLWIAAKLAEAKKVAFPGLGDFVGYRTKSGKIVVVLKPTDELDAMLQKLDSESPRFFTEIVR